MRIVIFFTLVLSLVSCVERSVPEAGEGALELPEGIHYEFGFPTTEFDHIEGQIKRNEFFSTLMTSLGADNARIYALTQASSGVFDLRTIRAGNEYKAYYTEGEERRLAYVVYEETKTSFITFGLYDSIFVQRNNRDINRRLVMSEATISSSLWMDLYNAGITVLLANELSEIYQWTIDFFGLQKGDHFQAIYEELYIGDSFLDVGQVYSATFTHAGRRYDAYRFVQDESVQYFNEEGENLRKAFLKAPLNFTRISSGFSYSRLHPITRVVRPHTGVDYAAPAGTPVRSIGDGVVTRRSYDAAGGNTVRIRHNSVYETAYLHLSRYAQGLNVGSRVRMGEVIGYVGSTGSSTGPHLDFRVWRNGSPINPLTMESPPAEPVSDSNRELFRREIISVKSRTDSIRSLNYIDSLLVWLDGGIRQ